MSKRSCEEAITSVYLYLDNELGWVHAAKIKRHLRHCDGCLDAFRFEEQLKVVIRERVREEPKQEVLDRLRVFLKEQEPGFGD
ncbi:MAG: anti-sigma factor [Gammaproteobacteria bacterium]|nr:anti-sigma factor [Gammaproteobacteria bacterium]